MAERHIKNGTIGPVKVGGRNEQIRQGATKTVFEAKVFLITFSANSFNSIFFDRLIAAFSMKGNAGFFIYLADSVGYVGSVSVMLVKEGMSLDIKWTAFFSQNVMALSFIGVFITIYAMYYFSSRAKSAPLVKLD